jgi:hypothetical protein
MFLRPPKKKKQRKGVIKQTSGGLKFNIKVKNNKNYFYIFLIIVITKIIFEK